MRKAVIYEKSAKWGFDFANTEKPIAPCKVTPKVTSPETNKSRKISRNRGKENSVDAYYRSAEKGKSKINSVRASPLTGFKSPKIQVAQTAGSEILKKRLRPLVLTEGTLFHSNTDTSLF